MLEGYPDAANHSIDAARYALEPVWKRGIVLKKMDGQWSPPKAAIYDKTDHNPVHAMAF